MTCQEAGCGMKAQTQWRAHLITKTTAGFVMATCIQSSFGVKAWPTSWIHFLTKNSLKSCGLRSIEILGRMKKMTSSTVMEVSTIRSSRTKCPTSVAASLDGDI